MLSFSDDDQKRMLAELEQQLLAIKALELAIISYRYRSEKGEEYGIHGLARRLKTLATATEKIFETIPVDTIIPPFEEERILAEIYIQACYIHTSGSIDNLAHIWVYENGLKKADGSALSGREIGLRPREKNHRTVLRSLPAEIREKLVKYKEWLEWLDEYRDSLAHRVPLYIPPYAVAMDKLDRDRATEGGITQAIKDGDVERYDALEEEQKGLRFFKPVIQHSWNEGALGLPYFHPQMLANNNTILELANAIYGVLGRI